MHEIISNFEKNSCMDFGIYNAENLQEIPGTDSEMSTYLSHACSDLYLRTTNFLKLRESCHTGSYISFFVALCYVQANIKYYE